MKALLLFAATCTFLFLAVTSKTPNRVTAAVAAPTAVAAAAVPTPADYSHAETILGGVIQVAPGGLLVHDRNYDRNIYLVGHPAQNQLADHDAVDCLAVEDGVFRYTNTLGASTTVHRFVYLPPKAKTSSQPGGWMFSNNGRTLLDQRAH